MILLAIGTIIFFITKKDEKKDEKKDDNEIVRDREYADSAILNIKANTWDQSTEKTAEECKQKCKENCNVYTFQYNKNTKEGLCRNYLLEDRENMKLCLGKVPDSVAGVKNFKKIPTCDSCLPSQYSQFEGTDITESQLMREQNACSDVGKQCTGEYKKGEDVKKFTGICAERQSCFPSSRICIGLTNDDLYWALVR